MVNFTKEEHYFNNVRTDLLALLPSIRGRFLEIGCGTGMTLQALKAGGAEYVAGVDINKEAVALASEKNIDEVFALDVERSDLPFADAAFDCMIFGDVLEHLYNPWDTLKKMTRYLKKGGYVLASIPNIKHYPILVNLVFRDAWTYVDEGVLDNSHLRFFTLKEMKKLMGYANLEIVRVQGNQFASRKFMLLNYLCCDRLRPFTVLQYCILAKK